MGDKKKTFIAFFDDDGEKREDWITLKNKTISYVEFEYQGKLISVPWTRILKLKEEVEG